MKVKNYPLVSIIPKLSKIFERIMYYKTSLFFEDILSEYQFTFRKDHIIQNNVY